MVRWAMRTSAEGIALIQSFESCALTAYQDQGGRWTIGWGRTRGVKPGDICTQDQADAWFLEDLAAFELIVGHLLDGISLTVGQFDAVVSFCYNVGLGYPGVKDGFQKLKYGGPSTLYVRLLAEDYPGAAAEFPKWCKAAGAENAGILRRRLAEQALFLKEA